MKLSFNRSFNVILIAFVVLLASFKSSLSLRSETNDQLSSSEDNIYDDDSAIDKLAQMHKKILLKKINKNRKKFKGNSLTRNQMNSYSSSLSHNSLEELIKNPQVKIYQVHHPKVLFLDDYYPFKYVFHFLNYMLKNFQIKFINPQNNRWTIEVFKNYLSCKNSHHLMIPKTIIKEIEEHFADFKKLGFGEYYLIFSRVVDGLQKISNLISSQCSNFQNFLNFVRHRLIAQNLFNSTHFDRKSFKHLAGWIRLHLKRNRFTKAGIDLGKLLTILAENLDYQRTALKSSKTVRKTSIRNKIQKTEKKSNKGTKGTKTERRKKSNKKKSTKKN